MMMLGLGAAAAALPVQTAHAEPLPGDLAPNPAPTGGTPPILWQDEFNGPAGSPPDPAS